MPSGGLGEITQSGFEDSGGEAAVTVVRTVAEFPSIQGVLTSENNPNPSLVVPADLKDLLIAVQLNSTQGRIYVDPGSMSRTMRHIPAIQAGLSSIGISAGGRPFFAETSVIAAIRKGHTRSADEGSSSKVGSTSHGAQTFRSWIAICHQEKATDLHIRCIEGFKAKVQMRVNGELEDLPTINDGVTTRGEAMAALKAAYEVLSDKHSNNTGTFSETANLSSMIDSALGIANLRIRFATVRGLHGVKGVMRLLPSSAQGRGMSFAEMGFSADQIQLFERSQRLGVGAIGHMGVTGSGKTTAAKTYIDTHPGRERIAMYQVADPIEYPVKDMHQIYVQRDLVTLAEAGKKDAYSEVIESLLRLDPELIDVGEVRDVLSARAMANTAKSGHMAMFTLHTSSISGALNRLTDPKIGLSREELTAGDMLALLCYQSLVPILCESCSLDMHGFVKTMMNRKDEDSLREVRTVSELAKQLVSRFKMDTGMLRFRNPCGCDKCKGRGTVGLTILAEVMMPEAPWLDLAAQRKDREAMLWWRRTYSDHDVFSGNQSGKLVIEHAIYKASKGQIDPRLIEQYGQIRTLETLK